MLPAQLAENTKKIQKKEKNIKKSNFLIGNKKISNKGAAQHGNSDTFSFFFWKNIRVVLNANNAGGFGKHREKFYDYEKSSIRTARKNAILVIHLIIIAPQNSTPLTPINQFNFLHFLLHFVALCLLLARCTLLLARHRSEMPQTPAATGDWRQHWGGAFTALLRGAIEAAAALVAAVLIRGGGINNFKKFDYQAEATLKRLLTRKKRATHFFKLKKKTIEIFIVF